MFLVVCAVVPAFAGTDCKKGAFFGTYIRKEFNVDVFGNGTVIHNYIYQLTLHPDGTVNQIYTGGPDYMITFGTVSPFIGNWTCRSDGKLVVTMIFGQYLSTGAGDITSVGHIRQTVLFTVTDDNTLTRTQSRTRFYDTTQDPTDPNGGTLSSLSTATIVYSRMVTTGDADLNAP
jgi:hypothetical protein